MPIMFFLKCDPRSYSHHLKADSDVSWAKGQFLRTCLTNSLLLGWLTFLCSSAFFLAFRMFCP